MMNDQADEIFLQACELTDLEARDAFLAEACRDEPELLEFVRRLLANEQEAESYFAEVMAQKVDTEPTVISDAARAAASGERPGQWIGRYQLLELIGEGGFGSVWRAAQTEPVTRQVALKIIKQGMDTKQVVARFEAERQALAMMDHPHIAKVHDAGATEAGRPYFVMELVDGIKITDYCDENNLSTEARLELFIKVCNAIQHAHQKGIIHRDIKPSNILVNVHDNLPIPKVIDFGIAKATEGKLTDATIQTQLHQLIGTPAYMSPEQAGLSGSDIDTRSDIYSAGVVLYELLTGKTPLDARGLFSLGFEAMCRAIREEDPPRPSTRLGTLQRDELTAIALKRSIETSRLASQLRGDLDWIVMKAISKERDRRYDTANGLAMDIQRFLTDEPVVARPPSTVYRLGKVWRRNKTLWATLSAIGIILVVATGISLRQAKLAREAADEAIRAKKEAIERAVAERTARDESDAVSRFLTRLLQSPEPDRDGRKVTVAELLDQASRNLKRDLRGHPDRLAYLQATIGTSYAALGLYEDAIPLLEASVDYFRAMNQLQPGNRIVMDIMDRLAFAYVRLGQRPECLQTREDLLSLVRATPDPDPSSLVMALTAVGDSYSLAGRFDEAHRLFEEALAISRAAFGSEHDTTIRVIGQQALALIRAGRNGEAITLLEQTLPVSFKLNGLSSTYSLWLMGTLSTAYAANHQLSRAIGLSEEALARSREALGPDHFDTLCRLRELRSLYDQAGRGNETPKLREGLIPTLAKIYGTNDPVTLEAETALALDLVKKERASEAMHHFGRASAVNSPTAPYAGMCLGALQVWFGNEAEYVETRQRLLSLTANTTDPAAAERVAKLACLRPITDAATQEAARRLSRLAVERGEDDPNLPWYQLGLGMAEYRCSNYLSASAVLQAAERVSADTFRPDLIRPTVLFYRAMSLSRLSQKAEAQHVFALGENEMPLLPADDQRPLVGGATHDHLILWLAYKEAKTVLDGSSSSAP